jgi:hypothetical protein
MQILALDIGTAANAFACRSSSRPAWRLGWFPNRFLIVSVIVELAFAIAVVTIPAAARLLDHRWPPAATWALVPLPACSAPAVLLVDGTWKRWARAGAASDGAGHRELAGRDAVTVQVPGRPTQVSYRSTPRSTTGNISPTAMRMLPLTKIADRTPNSLASSPPANAPNGMPR